MLLMLICPDGISFSTIVGDYAGFVTATMKSSPNVLLTV